eukprot:2792641-Pleurochrysis_carterae.AAC.1
MEHTRAVAHARCVTSRGLLCVRQVLERQMADKEQRDLSEHKRIYGALASIESASEARDAAAAAAAEAAAAAARNRRELEAQIASKQRERKTLKEKLKAEQARDDRDQARLISHVVTPRFSLTMSHAG